MTYSNYSFSKMTVDGQVNPGRGHGGGSTPGRTQDYGNLTVSVVVEDLAHFTPAGATVVQIFAAPLSASRTGQVRYKKILVGFTKALVAPQGTTTVEVVVQGEELGYTVLKPMLAGRDNHPRIVEAGERGPRDTSQVR